MNITQIIKDYEESTKLYQSRLQEEFKKVLNEFFKANPEVQVIKWSQYTPYWNDGETCEFSVNYPCFSNISPDEITAYGDIDGEVDEDIWAYGDNVYGEVADRTDTLLSKETIANISELDKLIKSESMEEIFKAMFGDHVVVICTPDEIQVEGYDHD